MEIKDYFIDEPTIIKERLKYKRGILDDLLDELENDKKQPKESDKIENDGKEKSNKLFNSMTKSFGTVSGAGQVAIGAPKTAPQTPNAKSSDGTPVLNNFIK